MFSQPFQRPVYIICTLLWKPDENVEWNMNQWYQRALDEISRFLLDICDMEAFTAEVINCLLGT